MRTAKCVCNAFHGNAGYITLSLAAKPIPIASRGGGMGETETPVCVQVLNIRRVKRNLNDFVARLVRSDVNIVVLAETWLYPDVEHLYSIRGFKSFFKSNSDYRAGGVAVLVREDLPCVEVTKLSGSECVCCIVEVRVSGSRCQVAGIYRSPSSGISDPALFSSEGIGNIL